MMTQGKYALEGITSSKYSLNVYQLAPKVNVLLLGMHCQEFTK